MEEQIGTEYSVAEYLENLRAIFREVYRVLRPDGSFWLNMGDKYANDKKWGGSTGGKHAKDLHGKTGVGRGKRFTGLRAKNMVGLPWRVALALQDDGWNLRNDVIWEKPNARPENVRDRMSVSHEHIFLLTKSTSKYYFDRKEAKEPGVKAWKPSDFKRDGKSEEHRRAQPGRRNDARRAPNAMPGRGSETQGGLNNAGNEREPLTRNMRSVWRMSVKGLKQKHFATFPLELPTRCIRISCPHEGLVLDPFVGSGTTNIAAANLGRSSLGIELNPKYAAIAAERFGKAHPSQDFRVENAGASPEPLLEVS